MTKEPELNHDNHDEMQETSSSPNGNGNGQAKRKGFLTRLRQRVRRKLSQQVSEEIHDLLDDREAGEEDLSEDEKELIVSALQLRNIEADDVSVPRSEIIAVDVNASFDDTMALFVKHAHSRVPVCGKDLDEILGFITLKDVVQYVGKEATFRVQDIMRACAFVPDSLPITSVLHQMRDSKVQMAIVVDEYGGTSGLISLKDILEQLVGEMEDEHEDEHAEMLTPLPGGRYMVDPRVEVDELEEALGIRLAPPEDVEYDYETLGGYVLTMAGRVPEVGEKFMLPGGKCLVVTMSDGRRIQKMELLPKE